MSDVTNAPRPPGKDPLTPGKRTSEFLATGVGMFLSALFALLAAFGWFPISEEQRLRIYEFCAVTLLVLPGVYTAARAFVKGKAVQNGNGK